MDASFGLDGTLITITARITQNSAVFGESNIINGPTVYPDRGYALTGYFRASAETVDDTLDNSFDVPAKSIAVLDWTIRKAVNQADFRLVSSRPAQERDTATLRSQIYRD